MEQNPNTSPPNTNTFIPMGFAQYESYINLFNSNSAQCDFQHPLTCNKTQSFNKTYSMLSLPCNEQPHNHHHKLFLKHKREPIEKRRGKWKGKVVVGTEEDPPLGWTSEEEYVLTVAWCGTSESPTIGNDMWRIWF